MRRFLIRLLVNAVALAAAAAAISGIEMDGGFWAVLGVAAVFTLVNGILRPIVALLSLPLIILTLGLFSLVVNAAMLLLTDGLTAGLSVDGFVAALMGSVVISLVNMVAGGLAKDPDRD